METRKNLDLSQLRVVPDVPALESLRPQRRPSLVRTIRAAWTPGRTLLTLALTPLAFWIFAGLSNGLATSGPAWFALTVLMGLGSAFVVTTYLGRGAASGGACGLAPLVWVGLAGWLLTENPTLLGATFSVVMVAVAMLQRITRPAC